MGEHHGASQQLGTQSIREVLKAMSEADWREILPRLVACTEYRLRALGWREGRDHRPSVLEVDELIGEAVKRCYEGRRNWDEENPAELIATLCGIIKSIAWDKKKSLIRRRTDCVGEIPEQSGEFPQSNDDIQFKDERLSRIEEAIGDDSDLQSFYLAALDGYTTREGMSLYLGWSPEKFDVIRKKLKRRLLKMRPEGSTP